MALEPLLPPPPAIRPEMPIDHKMRFAMLPFIPAFVCACAEKIPALALRRALLRAADDYKIFLRPLL